MAALERTCVQCRLRSEKESLLRFLLVEEPGEKGAIWRVVLDIYAFAQVENEQPGGTQLPGRGAYVHRKCVAGANAAEKLRRSLLSRDASRQPREAKKKVVQCSMGEILQRGFDRLDAPALQEKLLPLLKEVTRVSGPKRMRRKGKAGIRL